jgi:hypothetical protein
MAYVVARHADGLEVSVTLHYASFDDLVTKFPRFLEPGQELHGLPLEARWVGRRAVAPAEEIEALRSTLHQLGQARGGVLVLGVTEEGAVPGVVTEPTEALVRRVAEEEEVQLVGTGCRAGAVDERAVLFVEVAPIAEVQATAEGVPSPEDTADAHPLAFSWTWELLVDEEEVQHLVEGLRPVPATYLQSARERTLASAGALVQESDGATLALSLAGAVVLATDPGDELLLPAAALVVYLPDAPAMRLSAPMRELLDQVVEVLGVEPYADLVRDLVTVAMLQRDWSVSRPLGVEQHGSSVAVVVPGEPSRHPGRRNQVLRRLAKAMELAGVEDLDALQAKHGVVVDVEDLDTEVRLIVELPKVSESNATSAEATAVEFAGLSSRQGELVELLRARGAMTRREVEEAMGVGRSTARDLLARLVELGRVQRNSSGRRPAELVYELAHRQ